MLEAIDANLANYAIRHPDHCARSSRQEPAAMTQADRDALIRLLADLVADGEITEEQAAGILLYLAELTGAETMIPLPTSRPCAAQ